MSTAEVRSIGREIAAEAADLARQITVRWSQLAQDEPWLEHLTQIRQDNLPNLIRALARSALIDPDDEEAGAALIIEARRHGESRRQDGHDDSVIPAEFVLLRRSLRWVLVRQRDTAPHLLLPTIARLELAMGLAETASLHGYHADEESAPDRSDDRLFREWSGLFHEIVE